MVISGRAVWFGHCDELTCGIVIQRTLTYRRAFTDKSTATVICPCSCLSIRSGLDELARIVVDVVRCCVGAVKPCDAALVIADNLGDGNPRGIRTGMDAWKTVGVLPGLDLICRASFTDTSCGVVLHMHLPQGGMRDGRDATGEVSLILDALTMRVHKRCASTVSVVFPPHRLDSIILNRGALNELAPAVVGERVGDFFGVVARIVGDGCGARSIIPGELGDPAAIDFHPGFSAGLVVHPFGDIAVWARLRRLAAGSVIGRGGGSAQRIGRGGDLIQLGVGAGRHAPEWVKNVDDAPTVVVLVAGHTSDTVDDLDELAGCIVAKFALPVP